MRDQGFSEHQGLFVFGIICLLLSLGLIFFGIYILPFLFWDTNYGIPYFVTNFIIYFQEQYKYSSGASKAIVELFFLIPGLIAGLVSFFISNYIDKQVLGERRPFDESDESSEGGMRREIQASAGFGFKIFILMILVVVALFIIQSIFLG